MQNLTVERALELLNSCVGKSIAVIGDVMLDHYYWGNVSRISPEAPVPVVDLEKETYHLGGAANVANNLKSLGIEPLLCGAIGDDIQGKTFLEISKNSGIDTTGLYSDINRPTTVKTRIIGNNQQIARLDRETRTPLSPKGEEYILNSIFSRKDLSCIIFEDYNKGTISENIIKEVITYARKNEIAVFVDPKSDNFFTYKGVTFFKPNKKEAAQALGIAISTEEEIMNAGKLLLQRIECENVLLTLGSMGMMLFESNGNISSVPTRARYVADVSGAGDTAIATLSAAIAAGASVSEASALANYAAGAVCEMPGIVSITKESLINVIAKNNKK